MKKVLIITYYWPPMGGGGVQRWLKTVKYLREFGWEPIVFTPENAEVSQLDPSLVKEVPEGIEVVRSNIWEPFDLYRKVLGKKKDEKIQPGFLQESKGNATLQKLSIWVRGNFFIPDAKMFWIKPGAKALVEYLRNNKVDVIVSTGPPHTTHMIARKAHRKTGVPWLADFRDPWTFIDFYDKLQLTKWADARHRNMEKRVFKEASKVVCVSWSWAKEFERIQKREVEVITNGFDPADFEGAGSVPLDKKLTITHAGSLNADRNPVSLWQALQNILEAQPDLRPHLELQMIGPMDVSAIEGIKNAGLEKQLNHIANLPHDEVVKRLMTSHLLLLPLNDTPNIDGVVPGKLYEYLGAKRPIVCIGKPTGDSARIINETGAGFVADFGDVAALQAGLEKQIEAWRNNALTVNSSGIDAYSRKALAGKLAKAFEAISG